MKPIDKIIAPVKKELGLVEKKIDEILKDNVFKEKFDGTFLNKGKKLRPIYLFLLSRALGYFEEDIVDYGVIVELLHNASLVHDDIIDHSPKRRGENTFNSVYGNNIAVLLGDLLFLSSNKLAIQKRNFKILDVLTKKNENLLIGEIEEGLNTGNIELTENEYMKIIKNKTASLFELVGEISCILAKIDEQEGKKIREMSSSLGLSFQIIDDVLDFVSDVKRVGKPVMNDLKEKTLTLPIILAIRKNKGLKDKIKNFFKDVSQESLLMEIREDIINSGGLNLAKERALSMLSTTKKIIETFSPSKFRKSLIELVDFMSERSF